MNFLVQAFATVVSLAALLQVSVGQDADPQCMAKVTKCTMVYTSAIGQRFGNVNGLVELCNKRQEVTDCLSNIEGDKNCMTAKEAIETSIEDLLVKSKVCENIPDIEKHAECFSKQETFEGCAPKSSGDPEKICEVLEDETMCISKKVKEVCGEKASEVMYFLPRAIALNIAKAQGKTCPGLETSGVEKMVSVSMVILGLFSVLVGTLAVN